MHFIKVLLTDLAGVALIILSILTGWIPGPGGVPLFIAGLGLLAINHEWARRWLRYVKTHSLRLAEAFFRDHPLLMIAYDVVALIMLAIGAYVLIEIHGSIKALSLLFISIGLALFLGNRKRLRRITQRFRRQT